MYIMNAELKYAKDCWYCNAIIEALLEQHKSRENFGLLSNMFLESEIVKLVDGENEGMPKRMSRKTAFKHVKELKQKGYLENGYANLKLAYSRLAETANSAFSFIEVMKFKDETIYQLADFLDKMHNKFLAISFLRVNDPDTEIKKL